MAKKVIRVKRKPQKTIRVRVVAPRPRAAKPQSVQDWLLTQGACVMAREFAARYETLKKAYWACRNPQWMAWLYIQAVDTERAKGYWEGVVEGIVRGAGADGSPAHLCGKIRHEAFTWDTLRRRLSERYPRVEWDWMGELTHTSDEASGLAWGEMV